MTWNKSMGFEIQLFIYFLGILKSVSLMVKSRWIRFSKCRFFLCKNKILYRNKEGFFQAEVDLNDKKLAESRKKQKKSNCILYRLIPPPAYLPTSPLSSRLNHQIILTSY